nr:sulfotransferase domain-containing protein [Nocardioidaceae bacterium]
MTERLPNFVYIGPSKAGSTWLHEVLIRHPQVFMTDAKDLYFFDRYFARGPDWYAAHFRQAGPEHAVVGEVCQEYLSSPEAPARMYELLGDDLRLMLTLRDPVARAFSGYLYMQKHGVFHGTFREAMDTRPKMFEHSSYAMLVSRFLVHFDTRRIHFGVFDELVESPQHFIDRVLSWLEVEPMHLDESLLAARLPASKARSRHLAGAVKRGANWARTRGSTTLI